jgi:hypothetical protein
MGPVGGPGPTEGPSRKMANRSGDAQWGIIRMTGDGHVVRHRDLVVILQRSFPRAPGEAQELPWTMRPLVG